MPDISAMKEMLARVESATGPDRELDARLSVLFGVIVMKDRGKEGISFFEAPIEPGQWAFLSGCKTGEADAYRELGTCLGVPGYTRSLDACVALIEKVLPGWNGMVDFGGGSTCTADLIGPVVEVGSDEEGYPFDIRDEAHGEGKTPPLALLAATLRALLQIEERKAGGRGAMSYSFFSRSLRFISRSIASRIMSKRGSPSASTASMRAVVPSASGNRSCSVHSFLRPMRRDVACT
jgi:hypothetical protein